MKPLTRCTLLALALTAAAVPALHAQMSGMGAPAAADKTMPAPQEAISIGFEHTAGNKTQLHVKWETTDVYVPVVVQ